MGYTSYWAVVLLISNLLKYHQKLAYIDDSSYNSLSNYNSSIATIVNRITIVIIGNAVSKSSYIQNSEIGISIN